MEFATSVNTDTGGEFLSGADQLKHGQDGATRQAESRVSGDPGEFATSVSVGFGPIWAVPDIKRKTEPARPGG